MEKKWKIDLANKAYSLRIFAFGGSEFLLLGNTAYLGFQQITHRKERIAQLLLRKLAEKITLVFIGVTTCQQVINRRTIGSRGHRLATIVSRGNKISTQFESLFQEDIEFDFAVAKDIGIGRTPPLILGKHVIDNSFAVIGREVNDMQRNIETFGHQLGKNTIVVGMAFPGLQESLNTVRSESKDIVEKIGDDFPMIFEEKRVNSRKVYEGAILNVRVDTVTAKKGHAYREIVEHNGAVAAVALTEDDQVLMIRQYRYACDRVVLEIPAGKIERGETDPEAAMLRELKEETGYSAGKVKYLGCINPSVGYSEEVIHLYLMTGLKPGQQALDDDEALDVELMPFEEVYQMAAEGKLADAKTIAGIFMAKHQR